MPSQQVQGGSGGVSSFMTNLWGTGGSAAAAGAAGGSGAAANSTPSSGSPPPTAPANTTTTPPASTSAFTPPSASNDTAPKSRPGTSSGPDKDHTTAQLSKVFSRDRDRDQERDKDRRPSFVRKSSASSFISGRRSSSSSATNGGNDRIKTDASAPPALPEFALAAAAKISPRETDGPTSPTPGDPSSSFSRMIRPAPPVNGYYVNPAASPSVESLTVVHQHIQETANKRISTLDYLRKAHEGRIYWFNTLLFDKPDLARMPYFDSRKLARRATNYLLLGLSLPVVIDLNSSTPMEFLRSLNTLLAEFDSYQQIHTENGTQSSSLSRARLPQMFRRGPGGKGRRQSAAGDLGYDGDGKSLASGSAVNSAPTSVINFGLGGEGNDLVPGEEYTHLLTPNLPFEPDFFETFATLCDTLIDCYTRLLSLLSTPKDCNPAIAELFTKADVKVRKIIIQGMVKEFEDSSRSGLKQEVSNISKVVMGGLVA